MHLDYVPRQYRGQTLADAFKVYVDKALELGCCNLSVLHMPIGGHFTFIESDFLSGAENILKHFGGGGEKSHFFRKSSNY